jgi:His/Glu/Gln/Arg/opine family amino acid ABC transporter permease subunit
MQTFGWPEAYFILRAASWTIALTAIAFVIGGLFGGVLAIMRLSQVKLLRRFAAGYILVIQSIPVLMVLFMSYYGLSAVGIELPPFLAASASLAIYVSAYLAEIWRGSIESVPRQQWEASASLALTREPAIPLHHPAAGRAHLAATDGRLPRPAREEHLDRPGRRLRRPDARRHAGQQCDLSGLPDLHPGGSDLLRHLLPAFQAQPTSRKGDECQP